MDKEDLRDVKDQLEALDSLAKLFEKLWFAQVKNDVKDERVRAYLTVFDDAFPGFNQVVEFVRDSAGCQYWPRQQCSAEPCFDWTSPGL